MDQIYILHSLLLLSLLMCYLFFMCSDCSPCTASRYVARVVFFCVLNRRFRLLQNYVILIFLALNPKSRDCSIASNGGNAEKVKSHLHFSRSPIFIPSISLFNGYRKRRWNDRIMKSFI